MFTIERNLYILNIRPPFVRRSCLKMTGPSESTFIQMAQTASKGDSATSAASDAVKSNTLLRHLFIATHILIAILSVQKTYVRKMSSKVSCLFTTVTLPSRSSRTGKLGSMNGGFSTTE